MVEGPGCMLKGQKMKGRMKGKTVRAVAGNAVDRETKKKSSDGISQFHQLIGLTLQDVQTLGKELFMYFGEVCVRIHFLMAGSFRVNGQQLDKDFSKMAETASFELDMDGDKLVFYKSAAEVRPASACHQKFENLKDLDICSPIFSLSRAVAKVIEDGQGRQICDVQLDQFLLPGVGNIIKNEALFDSGIRPSTKTEEISEDHISFMIKMTRDFSMLFYKCRRDGVNLSKFYKVYGKGTCGQCGGKITKTRMGDDSPRVTYYCPYCQDNDFSKFQKRNLPQKNSLLGWINGKSDTSTSSQENWACGTCTLLNKYSRKTCSACFTPRDSESSKNPQSDTSKKDSGPPEKSPRLSLNPSSRLSANSKSPAQGHLKSSQGQGQPQGHVVDDSKIPICSQHKAKCTMQVTRKKGPNEKRMFFACSLPRNKQCQFFKWADEDFPICEGHGKAAVLRTVLKEGPNNGKKFFACSLSKTKQCGFFQWTEGYG